MLQDQQCQFTYSHDTKKYVACSKVSQIQNVRLELKPQFNVAQNSVSQTIFQYGKMINNVVLKVQLEQNAQQFQLFGSIVDNNIYDCKFELQAQQIDTLYGLTQSLSVSNTTIVNTAINCSVQNLISGNAFSLAQNLYTNLTITNFVDYSHLNATVVSMSSDMYYQITIQNSKFYQTFEGTQSASMITVTQHSQTWLYMYDCIARALITSSLTNNYALITVMEQSTQTTIMNLKGYISGAYKQLTPNGNSGSFTQEVIYIDINLTSTTLIDDTINVNNTYISIGNDGISAEDNGDLQLFSFRPIYYGIHLQESSPTINANSFALITQTISEATTISNLEMNLSMNLNAPKFAGISFTSAVQLTLDNCSYTGSISSSGSVFLLFETAQETITITDFKTNIEINFADASYGLIKTVQNGIDINGFSCNTTMQITGNQLVDSSLMFNTVSGESSIQNVNGIYGGYINGTICSGETCTANNSVINITMRQLSNITIYYDRYGQFSGYGSLYLYSISSSYKGKLNGTNITFTNKSDYDSSMCTQYLADAPIVQNTEMTAQLANTYSSSVRNAIGAISGISNQTSYTIVNLTVKLSFSASSSNATGNISSLFGVLRAPATIKNVKCDSSFNLPQSTVGGLIGILDGATVTMENIEVKGTYRSSMRACGGIIANITSGSQTTLLNATVDIDMGSMTAAAGPIYGQNNGTINQMTVNSITISQSSSFNNCPVGMGETVEIQQCPEKQIQEDIEIAGFPFSMTFNSNGYHAYTTVYYAIDNSMDYNNTDLKITMPDMSSVYENRSIFGQKVSYDNVTITITNDYTMRWSSDSYGFAYIQSLIDDVTVSMSNIHVTTPVRGTVYGKASGISQHISSNITLANISVTLTDVYFYYVGGIAYAINASNVQFINVSSNVQGQNTSGTIALLSYNVSNGISQFNLNNITIDMVYNKSQTTRGLFENITTSLGSVSLNNSNITFIHDYTTSVHLIRLMSLSSFAVNTTSINTTFQQSNSGGMLAAYAKITVKGNFTNVTMTGNIKCTGSTADIGTLFGNYTQGQQVNVDNVTINETTLTGQYSMGGLIGYLTAGVQMNVNNSFLNITMASTASYYGGFIGRVSSSSAQVYVSNSEFVNFNETEGVGCITSPDSNNKFDDNKDNVTCPAGQEQILLQVTSLPTYSANYYSSPARVSACYWVDVTETQANNSEIQFAFSGTSSSCGKITNTTISIFSPNSVPTTFKNVKTSGTINSQSGAGVGISFVGKVDENADTTFQDVVLSHTNQEFFSVIYNFNQYGFVYYLSTYGTVSFKGCQNLVTHNFNIYAHSGNSYAVGFVYYGMNTFSLVNCVSNFTTNTYQVSGGSLLKYPVGYTLSGCTAEGFETSISGAVC